MGGAYKDPHRELKHLQQIGSLDEYLDRFDLLISKVVIEEEVAVSWFVGGLRREV